MYKDLIIDCVALLVFGIASFLFGVSFKACLDRNCGYNPTGCVCGCVETGKCDCVNCNHPKLEK